MENSLTKRVHISIGDIGGISLEILFNVLKHNSLSNFNIYIYIPVEIKEFILKEFALGDEIHPYHLKNVFIVYFNAGVTTFKKNEVARENGIIAAKSLLVAVSHIKDENDILLTLPLNKEALNLAGYKFQGHTDFLQHITHSKEVYMSFWGEINTLLLTTHIPLKQAIDKVQNTEWLYGKIINSLPLVMKILKKKKENPVFAICGLNPHAGENGLIGEEDNKIKEVVNKLNQDGYNFVGPVPSDTIFYNYLKGKYDFIYSLYHDQALIPIKTFFLERSVNISLGLPFIRISPDHGTAFDIAYKGIANYKPLLYCFDFIKNYL